MSNANMTLCVVHVDLQMTQNKNPIPVPDEGEFIERRLVRLDELLAQLQGNTNLSL
jgi:hypothetical protein